MYRIGSCGGRCLPVHVALLHCKKVFFFPTNVGYLNFLPLVDEGESHSNFSKCVVGDYLANLPSGNGNLSFYDSQ